MEKLSLDEAREGMNRSEYCASCSCILPLLGPVAEDKSEAGVDASVCPVLNVDVVDRCLVGVEKEMWRPVRLLGDRRGV